MKEVKERADEFKSALRSYRYVQRKIQDIWFEIQQRENDLTGLSHHGRELTKEQQKSRWPMPHYQPGTGPSIVAKIMEIDQLKLEVQGLEAILRSIDLVLERMEDMDRALCVEYFADHIRADDLADRYCMGNRKSVHRRIESAIEHAV